MESNHRPFGKGIGPVIINNNSSGSIVDDVIDVIGAIHGSKKAKREAQKEAEAETTKRIIEQFNTPEAIARRQADAAERAARDVWPLETWLAEIDQTADEAIEKAEEGYGQNAFKDIKHKVPDWQDKACASAFQEFREKTNRLREEFKSLIEKNFQGKSAISELSSSARVKVLCARGGFKSKISSLNYKMVVKASTSPTVKFFKIFGIATAIVIFLIILAKCIAG
jgi:hypothetical protein